MTTPAPKTIGNDSNPPRSAAAIALTTINVMLVTTKPVVGAMRIPAIPARAAPVPQVSVASPCGDQPSVAAASGLSATAVIARPRAEYLVQQYNAMQITPPIPRRHSDCLSIV